MKHARHADPYGKGIFYTMLVLATSHLGISFFWGLMHDDPDIMNMFHILGFDLLIPALGKGSLSALLGAAFVVALWGVIVVFLKHHESRRSVVKPSKKS